MNNVVYLADREINDLLLHPGCLLKLLDELVLDVRYDLVAKLLSFSRESLLDEES